MSNKRLVRPKIALSKFNSAAWRDWLAIYRWDFLGLLALFLAVGLFVAPLWSSGYIVFSDLDFGMNSRLYLSEVFGVWNEHWSTPTMLNIARLPWIIGPWLLSGLFGWSGAVFLKSFITLLLLVSAGSMYWLCKRITSVYFSRHFDAITIFGLVGGALFYALNPWVVFRIQHVFLLCGYSLMPLCLLFFFNGFDPRFQRQFIADYQPSRVRLYRRHVFDLFCFALAFSVSAGAIHYFFYGIIFYSGIGFLLLINTLRLEKNGWRARVGILKMTVLKLLVTSTFFGFFSFFWLGSYVGSILKHAQVSQHNVNVVDTLAFQPQQSTAERALSALLLVADVRFARPAIFVLAGRRSFTGGHRFRRGDARLAPPDTGFVHAAFAVFHRDGNRRSSRGFCRYFR